MHRMNENVRYLERHKIVNNTYYFLAKPETGSIENIYFGT